MLVATGLAADAVVHDGIAGVAGALLGTALAIAAIWTGRRPAAAGAFAAAAVVAVTAWSALRTNPWLLGSIWLVALVSLPLVTLLGAGRGPGGAGFQDVLRQSCLGLRHAALAPLEAVRLADDAVPSTARGPAVRRLAKGIALALPVVVVLGALLASADPLFARFLRPPLDLPELTGHVLAGLVGVAAAMTLVLLVRRPVTPAGPAESLPVGGTEVAVVLAGLVGVFGCFAAVQSLAFLRGPDYVESTIDLTYAEYARQGFFQLIAVVSATVVVLLAVRPVLERTPGRLRTALRVLGAVAVLLALVIAAVAHRRLDLYQEAFGLTMLRLGASWATWWLGLAMVVVLVAWVGVGRRRQWLPTALTALLLGATCAAAAANPAAVVVHANVDRAEVASEDPAATAGPRLDVEYLLSLGDDAVPALMDRLDDLPPSARDRVLFVECRLRPLDPDRGGWNLSQRRAEDARRSICPS